MHYIVGADRRRCQTRQMALPRDQMVFLKFRGEGDGMFSMLLLLVHEGFIIQFLLIWKGNII